MNRRLQTMELENFSITTIYNKLYLSVLYPRPL